LPAAAEIGHKTPQNAGNAHSAVFPAGPGPQTGVFAPGPSGSIRASTSEISPALAAVVAICPDLTVFVPELTTLTFP
jgi:hypothetical protein